MIDASADPQQTQFDPNFLQLDQLFEWLNPPSELAELMARLKREDLGSADGHDVTTEAMTSQNTQTAAEVVSRGTGTIAGLRAIPALIEAYFRAGGNAVEFTLHHEDGSAVCPGTVIATLTGPTQSILLLERPLLNLLGRLSGIATLTEKYVNEIAGCQGAIYDTRKTTPGLRGLEKYAVRCGGGRCHRIGLYDAILVKDNHLDGVAVSELTAFLTERLTGSKEASGNKLQFVEVEVDSIAQLEAVLACPHDLVDIALLDNMNIEELCAAVALREQIAPEIELEASGNVNLTTVRSIAITAVDRISVGALTHSAPNFDLGLDF